MCAHKKIHKKSLEFNRLQNNYLTRKKKFNFTPSSNEVQHYSREQHEAGKLGAGCLSVKEVMMGELLPHNAKRTLTDISIKLFVYSGRQFAHWILQLRIK